MTLRDFIELTRLNKPVGIYLLLWPTLWALWLSSQGSPGLKLFLIFVLGVIFMRSAGCIINDIADRKVDPHVERTQDRPIASGRVTARSALLMFFVLVLCSALLVLQTNWLTIALAPAALALASLYPFMKRFTHMPQVFLGAAFGWAVPMAFAAQTEDIPFLAWWLWLLTVLWVVAYDTMYAMVDKNDDLKIGVKSTAILFGRYDIVVINALQAGLLVNFVALGIALELLWVYFVGVAVAAVVAVYQHLLLRERQREKCFKAFLVSHYLGAMIFLGIAGHYLMVP